MDSRYVVAALSPSSFEVVLKLSQRYFKLMNGMKRILNYITFKISLLTLLSVDSRNRMMNFILYDPGRGWRSPYTHMSFNWFSVRRTAGELKLEI